MTKEEKIIRLKDWWEHGAFSNFTFCGQELYISYPGFYRVANKNRELFTLHGEKFIDELSTEQLDELLENSWAS